MSRKPCFVLSVCLLFAALCLVGCRDTQTPTSPPPTATALPPTSTPSPTPTPTATPTPSPQELLQAAFDWQTSHSYHFEMDITGIVSGGDLEEDLKISMHFNADFQPPDRIQATMQATVDESQLEMRMIVIGDVSYVQDSRTGAWSIQDQSELLFDPDSFAMDGSNIQDLRQLEPVTYAGAPAYHLTGRVVVPFTFPEPFGEMDVEYQANYWLSQADGRLLQSDITGQVDFTAEYGLKVEVFMTMHISELDVLVEITAPQVESLPQSTVGALLPPLASDDAQGHLERGLLSFEDDRPGLAAAHFTRLIELDPTISEAYLYRGLAWAVMDEDYGAPNDFGQYLSMHPEDAQAYFLRAQFPTYDNGKTPSDACADVDTALQLSPDLPEALTMKAQCVCMDAQAGPERVAQAFALFAQARELDAPGVDSFYPPASELCFRSLYEAGEIERIEEFLPQLDADIAAHPELPGGYLVRAYAILWLREYTIQESVDAWSDIFRYLQRGDCGMYPQMYNGFDRQDNLAAARRYATNETCENIDMIFDGILFELDLSGVDALMAEDAHFKAQYEQFQQEVQKYSTYTVFPQQLLDVSAAVLSASVSTQLGRLVFSQTWHCASACGWECIFLIWAMLSADVSRHWLMRR